jgi:hypothetical protein
MISPPSFIQPGPGYWPAVQGTRDPVRATEACLPKIEEWIEGSKRRIRADMAHEKILAQGYTGSARSTRRIISATGPGSAG